MSAATDAERPLVDVRDMIAVHTAMLRELRLAPADVRRTAAGDRRQAAMVAGHIGFICELLHHHHQTEDELLWPRLIERTGPEARSAIDAGEAQHAGLDACLERVGVLRRRWADTSEAADRDALADGLAELHALLRDHLDFEERRLLPLAACVLTKAEWDEIGERGAAAMSKPELILGFGMFAYEGDPAVVAGMLAAAPAPVRVIVSVLSPKSYARRARRVHGTPRP